MRFGRGGPRGNVPYTGSRGSSGNAIQSQFRLDWDDTALIEAITAMGLDGPKAMKNILKASVHIAIEEVQKRLKKMAGPLAHVTVPSWQGFRKSKSIHTTIAESLKQDDIAGTSFIRVHTAKDPAKANLGRIGSRGLNISRMLVEGIKPFKYSPFLPELVRSSVGWYAKTGSPGDFTIGMMKNGRHPGFTRTFDYMLAIEQITRKEFEKNSTNFVEKLAAHRGFRL